MHHSADSYRSQCFDFSVILLLDIFAKVTVAILNAKPYSLDAVGPKTVDKLVFPLVTALRYGTIVFVDKDCLDAGRAKLYTKDGLTCLNG